MRVRPTRPMCAARTARAVAVLTALLLAAGLLLPSSSVAATARQPTTPDAAPVAPVLAAAQRVLAGDPLPTDPEPTLALRDLFLARPTLSGAERAAADELLARPSEAGGGTTSARARAVVECSRHFCLHYPTSGADAPPSTDWVAENLRVLELVWRHHVDRLGYRAPASDGGRGGNAKFDVYLQQLGSRGLYGYCSPVETRRGSKRAPSFCVLDNDFSREEFNRAPLETLRVTAAHEFFHAIQFNYDFREDKWLLEATATWMEERFADAVNDNRNYLPYGQLAKPSSSLDVFANSGFNQYANWTFFEYLGQRYGNGIVRQILQRTGTGGGLPDDYSVEAVRTVLTKRGGFPRVFAAYAAANTLPARYYSEGDVYPAAGFAARRTLSSSSKRAVVTTKVNHLASANVLLTPAEGLGSQAQAVIKVDGPGAATSPAAYVIARLRGGGVATKPLRLNRQGVGTTRVAFDPARVSGVSVTLANASTRYRCNRGTSFACSGTPRDQGRAFKVVAELR